MNLRCKVVPAIVPAEIASITSRKLVAMIRLLSLILCFAPLADRALADCAPSANGLVAWWSGDANAQSLIGTNHGTLQGGATANSTGFVGNGFNFDGTNGFVSIPDSPALRPTNFTIEAWVKVDAMNTPSTANPGVQFYVFKQNTRASFFEGYWLGKSRTTGTDTFTFGVCSAAGAFVAARSSTIQTGIWYHVAAVRGSNYLQIFTNGVLSAQATVTFPQDYGNQPLYFGSSGVPSYDSKLKGNLDEVSLYNRALSPSEIAAAYASGAEGRCKAPVITLQPQSQNLSIGGNANFNVVATGFGALSYQWRFNSTNIYGATNATLSLTNLQLTQQGNYSVAVSNALGFATSQNAVLTVIQNCSAQSPGLVGWWRGENNSSDVTGASSASTLFGIAYAPGLVGQAFDFNGTARRLSIADAPQFYLTNALTLEAWVYPRTYGGFIFFRGDNRGGLDPYFLELTSGGLLRFVIGQDNSNYAELFAPIALAQWTHVAATWDRATGYMRIFTNGTFAAQLATPLIPIGALDPTSEPAIGIGNHGGTFHGNPVNGLIDEPAIYSRALAAAEIQAICSTGNGGKCFNPTPPFIFAQPHNRVFQSSSTLKLTAVTGGTQPLSHHWYYNGTPLENNGRITGADSDILTITNTLIADSGSYGYQVSNSLGVVTSTVATVLVGDAPVLQTVTSQTVLVGSNATFTATAVGSEPIVYHWQFNSVNLTNDARISGATNTVLNILNVSLADAGIYVFGAANPFASASTPAVLTVVEPPSISNQPMGATIPAGTNFTFTVSTLGTAPFQYQWHFNQAPLPYATNSTLALTNVQSANAGDYSVVVTNLYASVTSAVATLVVTPTAPVFTLNPSGRTVTKGAEVTFTTAAKGSEPISYQWQFNGTNIAGAESATLTLTNAQFTNAGNYSLTATNAVGSTNSADAVLNVTPPPGFLWTRKGGGANVDEGRSVVVDAQGNIYAAGTFVTNASFSGTNPPGFGSSDLFVAKYDHLGQLIWIRSAGSTGADSVNGVAVDAAGNVCIVGSVANFPNFSGTILTNYGGHDAFIAKYSSAGDLLWVTNFGGTSIVSTADAANAIAIDGGGRIFVTGNFNGTGFFGGTVISNTLSGAAFVARFSADGNADWVRASAGNAFALGTAIITDSHGNVLVAGMFSPAFILFGSVTITNNVTSIVTPSLSLYDMFFAKYDTNGNLLWAQKAGGTGADMPRGIALDGGGNSYIVGEFNGTVAFGGTTLTAASTDVFLMKIDPSGVIQWGQRAGGTSTDAGNGVSVDVGGNAFITGSYSGTANFGGVYSGAGANVGIFVGGTNLSNSGSTDAFVAMYTTAGELRWALKAGGTSTDIGRNVLADNSGSLLLSGAFSTTTAFGHQTHSSTGSTDFFLSKLAAFDADAAAALVAQPASQTNAAGSTVTISVGVIAPGPISYQWQFNGANIPGATNLSLTLVNIIATNSGAYSVHITTPNGNLFSTSAVLTVVTEPDFLWAKHFGGSGNDECLAVAADANGNTYAAGYFSGTTDFGVPQGGMTSNGGEDGFVAKFDAAQNLVWLRQLGGTNNDRANAIALDSAGNVIVAGQFSDTVDFGGTNLTSFGSNDVFLAKFDAAGALLWARQAGNTNSDFARSVAVHTNGDIAVAGQFQLNAVFEGVSVTNRNTSGWDVFVARYDSAGQLLWVQGAGYTSTPHDDRVRGVAFDPSGNVLTCGSFLYGITFGSVSLNYNRAGQEIFMAKYSPTGGVLWARSSTITLQTPQSVDDEAMAVASDRNGNIFLAGYFQNQITMASNTIFAANTNVPDMFLARYDANGTALWLRTGGGVGADSALALATDNSGNALLAGSFNGPAQFGLQTLTGIGGSDAFAAMYDATGNLLKLRKLGGMGDDAAQTAAYDGRGNLVLGGFHTGAAVVGTTPLPGDGGRDAFVTKLSLYDPDLAPLITTQPLEQTVGYGKILDLAVGVTSGSSPSYQWLFNNAPLSGATNGTLRLTNFQYAAVGNYSVIVTNGFGAVTSSVATVTVELFPEFPWLQRAGGTGDDQAFALAMDSQTNLYMAGHFTGTALFTNGFFGTNISLVSTGLSDIFLTKHNAAGKLLWARRAGGTHEESAQSLAVDPAGNILLTGYFRSTQARFGSLVVTNQSNDFLGDIFVAKYDPDGNPLWAKRAGGIGWDGARSIAVDGAGDAYITGYCYWLATFGNITLTNGSSNFPSPTNYFVAKYSSAGDVVWAKSAVGTSTSPGSTAPSYGVIQGFGLCLDTNTNVIVTGHFLGTANFGSGFLANINNTFQGGSVFLTKYDWNGNLLWAKKGVAGATGVGQAMLTDASGNIYGTSFKVSYGTTYLLTKYDANGNLIWSRNTSLNCCTEGYVQGNALAFDFDGDILMVGGVNSSVTLEGVSLNLAGYVAKYRPDGVPLWVMRAGGWCYGVVPDSTGGAYLAGRYSGTGFFGPSSTNSLSPIAGNDIFLVKLGVKSPTATPQAFVKTIATDAGATLQVTTTGTGPFAYQWRFNGTNISGATGSTYLLSGAKWTNAGLYSVAISNTAGSFVSAPAAVNVTPKLYSEPSGADVKLTWGGQFTLQSSTNPAGPFTDLPGVVSPHFYPTSNDPLRFFRLKSEPFALAISNQPGMGLTLSGAGISGYNFILLGSTNLVNWTPLGTNISPFSFTTTNTAPQRFYRAMMAR